MIPFWKLKREWDRFKSQVWGKISHPFEPLMEARHRRWRSHRLNACPGAVGVSNRIAIFLVFQPSGLPASVYATLAELAQHGYAPLVVSNAPLSPADRDRLQPLTWQYFERPNYGYDFGGYRDGVWLVNKLGLRPEFALFLNDSVWFPALPDTGFLTEMESCPAQFVSTQVSERSETRSGLRRRRAPFLTSYCFLLRDGAFQSAAVREFWANYRATSNKLKTILRGERGLSYHLPAAGITQSSLLDRPRYETAISGLADDDLFDAITYLNCIEPELEARRARLLAAPRDADWPDRARALLCDDGLKNYFGAAPYVTLNILRFPLIKKNRSELNVGERRMIRRAIADGKLTGLTAPTQAELQNWD